jgi:hypothetical protein
MLVVVIVVLGISLRMTAVTLRRLRSGIGLWARCRSLNDLVEFSTVQPHTAAFGTIVDFHALTVGHDEVGFSAYWAFHKDRE